MSGRSGSRSRTLAVAVAAAPRDPHHGHRRGRRRDTAAPRPSGRRGPGRRGHAGRPPSPPTAASSSTVLPATSGSSASRRPIGPARGRPRPRGLDLVALVELFLDRRRSAVPGPHSRCGAVRRCPSPARRTTERGRLHDLAGERVADLDLLGHRADPVDERVAPLAIGGVDENQALVVDVDLRLELLLQRADRLAALADQQPDLLGVDLYRRDARGVLGELRGAVPRSPCPSRPG